MQCIYALTVALALGVVLLIASPGVANAQEAHSTTAAPGKERAASDRVVVSPGDSLWSISESRLGKSATLPRIAAGVDQIYLLNREQIGADPDLISPGQELVLPPSLKTEPRKVNRTAGPNAAQGETGAEEARAEVPADPGATGTKTAKAKPDAADKATPKVTLPDAAQAAPAPAARVLTSDGPSRSPVASFLRSLSSPVASGASSTASALAGYYADIREDANGRWLLGLATIALGLLAASLVARKLFAETKRNVSDAEAWRPYYSPLLVQPTAQQEDASARREGSREEDSREVPEKPAATEPGPNQRPSGIETPAPENDTNRVGLVGIARSKQRPARIRRAARAARRLPRRRLAPGAYNPEGRRSLRAARIREKGRT